MMDKEIRVHSAMKHINVLEFYNAVIVEPDGGTKYFPGIYMLLEIAAGGDLFDKIGVSYSINIIVHGSKLSLAPDVGIGEDVAQIYFNQLVAGLVRNHISTKKVSSHSVCRDISMNKVFVTEI